MTLKEKRLNNHAKNIQRWDAVALDPEIGHLGQSEALVFFFAFFLLRFTYWVYICTRARNGNNINSKKKQEREVMRLTHEHNRLDQRNLVFGLRFYLQTAGRSVGDEHSRGFKLRAPHWHETFELRGVVHVNLTSFKLRGPLSGNSRLRCRGRADVDSQPWRWSGPNSTVGALTSNSRDLLDDNRARHRSKMVCDCE